MKQQEMQAIQRRTVIRPGQRVALMHFICVHLRNLGTEVLLSP